MDFAHKKQILNRPVIALTGLMGSGKTTLGLALARSLGRPFKDSDHLIEIQHKKTIADIFSEDGEAGFRDIEYQTISQFLAHQTSPCILALGGGAITHEDTRKLILDTTCLIWLQTPIEDIVQRIGQNTNRPLLQRGNPHEILSEQLKKRQVYYTQAHLHVENTAKNPQDTIQHILTLLE
jgi:shikimate kinase